MKVHNSILKGGNIIILFNTLYGKKFQNDTNKNPFEMNAIKINFRSILFKCP